MSETDSLLRLDRGPPAAERAADEDSSASPCSIGTSEWEGLAPSMSHLHHDRLSF